jgi:hypothetical protein
MIRVCLLLTLLSATARAATLPTTPLTEHESPAISPERPAASIPHTDPADIVRADVAAQNAGDWDTYLALRTDLPGAPESVASYQAVWAQPENGIRGNVIAAHLENLQPLPMELAREAVDTCCYTAAHLRAFYGIVNYSVRTPDTYVRSGANARIYILAGTADGWKIVQVSEPLLAPIFDAGYATGNPAEPHLLDQQRERLRSIPDDEIPGAASRVRAETTQPYPSTIRVGNFSAPPECRFLGTVTTVNFTSYIRNVLPNEWPANFPMEALKAGALAVKGVGWHRKAVPFYPGLGVDVASNTCTQVYKPNSAVAGTDEAFCAVSGVAFEQSNGLLFYPSYRAGSYNGNGKSGGVMYQNGTRYLADRGYSYRDIAKYYYDYSSTTRGNSISFFQYAETGTACKAPTAAPTNLTPNNVSVQGSPIRLAWGGVQGAQSYNISVFSWNGSAWTKVATGTVTTTSAKLTISKAGWYAWQVQAANTAGSGPWSSAATIYFKP